MALSDRDEIGDLAGGITHRADILPYRAPLAVVAAQPDFPLPLSLFAILLSRVVINSRVDGPLALMTCSTSLKSHTSSSRMRQVRSARIGARRATASFSSRPRSTPNARPSNCDTKPGEGCWPTEIQTIPSVAKARRVSVARANAAASTDLPAPGMPTRVDTRSFGVSETGRRRFLGAQLVSDDDLVLLRQITEYTVRDAMDTLNVAEDEKSERLHVLGCATIARRR